MASKLKLLPLSLLVVAAAAVACTKYYGAQFDLNVGTIDRENAAEKIGNALQLAYGSKYGRGTDVEGTVRYQVRVLGWPGTHSIPFIKPCDKTFIEAANDVWEFDPLAGGGGAGGGMCGGLDNSGSTGYSYGIVGYTPIYRAGTTCSGSNCSSTGSVLVGYQPQWGLVNDGFPTEHQTYC